MVIVAAKQAGDLWCWCCDVDDEVEAIVDIDVVVVVAAASAAAAVGGGGGGDCGGGCCVVIVVATEAASVVFWGLRMARLRFYRPIWRMAT
jgi:hypothetical protein